MKRGILVATLFLLGCGVGLASGDRNPAEDQRVEPGPNPRLACPLGREPTQEDFARLNSVAGHPTREVIRRLGHPSMIIHLPGSSDTAWWYDWGTHRVRVQFRAGRVVSTDQSERQTGFVESRQTLFVEEGVIGP